MLILGFQQLTLLDYPGKLSALIFTGGCMWRCGYCQNPELVLPERIQGQKPITEERIISFLKKRKKLLDGLSISGGEPTIQPGLKSFIKRVKELGYLVKLDTNGTNPEIVKDLISEKLIDYIAMDVKSTYQSYNNVTRVHVNFKSLENTINLLKKAPIEYEFRTTVIPMFHTDEEIEKIAQSIKGAKIWYLQQFQNKTTLDPKFRKILSYSDDVLERFKSIGEKYIQKVEIRV